MKSHSEWDAVFRQNLPPGGLIARVGSRATCSPPPTDTDEDFLVLVPKLYEATLSLMELGFETESDPEKIKEYAEMHASSGGGFASLRLGDVNYIVTESPFFFERFLTGAYVCRELNLMRKEHRVMVHAAVRGATYAAQYLPEWGGHTSNTHTQYVRKKLINGVTMLMDHDVAAEEGLMEAVARQAAEKDLPF